MKACIAYKGLFLLTNVCNKVGRRVKEERIRGYGGDGGGGSGMTVVYIQGILDYTVRFPPIKTHCCPIKAGTYVTT